MKNKPKAPRDIYVAIARAEMKGRGVHLTAQEVWQLAQMDDAIYTAAEMCTSECVCDIRHEPKGSCDFCSGGA